MTGGRILTIVACPKAFGDQRTATIQRNAVGSWIALDVKPEILLVGEEAGVAGFARELGVRHVGEIPRNKFGTPLLSGVLELAEAEARGELICYVNADIIFLEDFSCAIREAAGWRMVFVAGGRRCNLEVSHAIDFTTATWASELRRRASSEGVWGSVEAIDYFVFRRGSLREVPAFAIGRGVWDWGILGWAKKQGAKLVDMTPRVLAIHQNHDYGHGRRELVGSEEWLTNVRLLGSVAGWRTLADADFVLTCEGLTPACWWRRLGGRSLVLWRWVLVRTRPVRWRLGLRKQILRRMLLRRS
jgi:hypothetical protein